jgi:hypothetical protein
VSDLVHGPEGCVHAHPVPLIAVAERSDGNVSVTVTSPFVGPLPARFATVSVYVAPTCPWVNAFAWDFVNTRSGGGGGPEIAARNVATAAPHARLADRLAVAATDPALVSRLSSTISVVLDAGTRSSITKPLPAVNVVWLDVDTVPMMSSPLAVVVTVPLFGAVLEPCDDAARSSEAAGATPEYSKIENLSVAEALACTETVLAPLVVFSAYQIATVFAATVSLRRTASR